MAAGLTTDEIHSLCDDLIEAHGGMLAKFKSQPPNTLAAVVRRAGAR